jgi:hypothetical protein
MRSGATEGYTSDHPDLCNLRLTTHLGTVRGNQVLFFPVLVHLEERSDGDAGLIGERMDR